MKKVLFSVFYLLFPNILTSLAILINNDAVGETYIFFAYLITLIVVILYFCFKPCGFKWLLIGLIISPLSFLIYEFFEGGWFQYLATALIFIFYAVPFTLLSLIIFIVTFIKNKQKAKKEDF